MTVIGAFAPGRVNLIGEHTDYNLGFALPIALELGTTVMFTPDGSAAITAVSDSETASSVIPLTTAPGGVTGWGAYVAGCVWVLGEGGIAVPGGRLEVSSDVPVGAGLSSSAALECAVLLALTSAADGPVPDRIALAKLAQRAENHYVGAPTGLLDQLASLCAEPDAALLVDFQSLDLTTVPADFGDCYRLLVIDSRAPHRHADGEYAARRSVCAAAAAELGLDSLRDAAPDDWRRLVDPVQAARARHVITENARVVDAADALRASDYARFGALMNASHISMRDDFAITTDQIDLIAGTAAAMGAIGARMTGGGFGGSVIALASAEAAERIIADLPTAVVDARFNEPTVRAVRPGAGAHLL
ncbi:galactokinase [Gordonia sp. (in: high G+C Gram-positive bacteria)]|uniref:galactokinase n=1 Tax=Gordonia sp. (in: high G+C Gram-positive bacteria) TaxID=84139 RepID=UPI003C725630